MNPTPGLSAVSSESTTGITSTTLVQEVVIRPLDQSDLDKIDAECTAGAIKVASELRELADALEGGEHPSDLSLGWHIKKAKALDALWERRTSMHHLVNPRTPLTDDDRASLVAHLLRGEPAVVPHYVTAIVLVDDAQVTA